ncbi:MAG: hypothetical protein EOP06_19055 [Proteobacteria bacterium]|nr:MAG: hypothetical protein EOP06_19055 [Pseudomonadota bacterium]
MTHEELIDIIERAHGPEEVAQAQALRKEWIANHPEASQDELFEIYSSSESLQILAEGYALRQAGKLPPVNEDGEDLTQA